MQNNVYDFGGHPKLLAHLTVKFPPPRHSVYFVWSEQQSGAAIYRAATMLLDGSSGDHAGRVLKVLYFGSVHFTFQPIAGYTSEWFGLHMRMHLFLTTWLANLGAAGTGRVSALP
jgi:hypothetical protein